MNNACSIYYDMQRDSFYRVDKQTGDMTRSFLNGDKLPLFHPNITGFEPKRRRSQHDATYLFKKQSPSRLSKINGAHFAKPHFRTISTSNNSSQIKNRFYDTLKKQDIKILTSLNQNSRKKLNKTSEERQNHDDELIKRIRKYEEIMQNRIKDNHSPLKNVSGSIQKEDMMKTICFTKQNFRSIEEKKNQEHRKINHRKPNKLYQLGQQFEVLNQIRKQRSMKSVGNNGQSQKSKEKSLEREKFRKQNLIKLERQMLKKNQKQFGQIFSSNQK